MNITLIACYAVIYAGFHAWTDKTERGARFKKFIQEWNTDWKHGILVSISVFIWACCAILALGLTLKKLGI